MRLNYIFKQAEFVRNHVRFIIWHISSQLRSHRSIWVASFAAPWPPEHPGGQSETKTCRETPRVWHLNLVFLLKGSNNVNASKFATFATCRKCNKTEKHFQSPCAVSGIQNNFNPNRNSESARRNAPDSVHGGEIRDIKCKTGQPDRHDIIRVRFLARARHVKIEKLVS